MWRRSRHRCSREITEKPISSHLGSPLHNDRVFKSALRAWHDLELFLTPHRAERVLIQPDRQRVIAGRDEQGWRPNACERLVRQVRSAVVHDGRGHPFWMFGRGHEDRCRGGTSTKVADSQPTGAGIPHQPVGSGADPLRQ
jgi:hypothetical protein